MAQALDELGLLLGGERSLDDGGDIEVAPPALVAAERVRPAGVHAREIVPEHVAQPRHELREIGLLGHPAEHALSLRRVEPPPRGRLPRAGRARRRARGVRRDAFGRAGSSSSTAPGRRAPSGTLEIRFAEHADDVLERLAVEAARPRRRGHARLVGPARPRDGRAGGQAACVERVRRRACEGERHGRDSALPEGRVEDALDPETRSRLERWRRGGA